MKIDELRIGSSISIHVKTDKGDADLQTTIIEAQADVKSQHVIFCEQIIENGKVVQPNDITQHYDMFWFDSVSGRLYKWSGITFRLVNKPGKAFYIIKYTGDSTITNRRNAFRLEVSLQAIVQIGENMKTYEAHIHDLSAIGMSITLSQVDDTPLHKTVSAVFCDESTGDRFRLTGTCVYVTNPCKNVWRCGCKIHKLNMHLSNYINRKQMEYARKQHDNR